jgi:ribosomal protein S18 acetylase RimI-like enzyme
MLQLRWQTGERFHFRFLPHTPERECEKLGTLVVQRMNVRTFEPSDLAALYDICLLTGDKGRDASATCLHPRLFGDYYAAPYATRDASSCLVLEDERGVCGYVLGAFDTKAYLEWLNREWLPLCRQRYAALSSREGACDRGVLEMLEHDAALPAVARDYPAHLHMNLLPRAQGKGLGRRLFDAWIERARASGARGVHLGVARENERAQAFYERCGMQRTKANPFVFVMSFVETSLG